MRGAENADACIVEIVELRAGERTELLTAQHLKLRRVEEERAGELRNLRRREAANLSGRESGELRRADHRDAACVDRRHLSGTQRRDFRRRQICNDGARQLADLSGGQN